MRNRILLIVALVLGLAWFTAGTWMRFAGVQSALWMVLPVLLIGSFAPVVLISFRWQHPLLRAAARVTAIAVGFLNFALVAAIGCWLALGIARLGGWPLDGRIVAAGLYGAAGLVTIYGLINAAWLRVTCVTVRLDHLPAAWHGREVALVTDIHLGNIRGPRFVRRIVARLQTLKPAAVFIAGDMFDGARVNVARCVEPWKALRPPAGTYFVSGNHDEFSDRGPYLAALERAGLRVLHNERVNLAGLQLVGVHDGEADDPKQFAEILRRAEIDPGRASVLLAHRPANLDVPEKAGIGLQLSGHTHRGQFWPWSFVVGRVWGRFAYGLHRQGKLQVYTSSGAGTWGPPLRVGSRSEIVVLRFEAA